MVVRRDADTDAEADGREAYAGVEGAVRERAAAGLLVDFGLVCWLLALAMLDSWLDPLLWQGNAHARSS